MAYLGAAFDPTTVEPAESIEPVPSGEYVAIITDSEMRPTKNGSGEYLELTHQVIEGEFKGRLIWARLNLINQSAKASQIAQQQLSAICHALGQTHAITDSSELHNRPLVIRVEYVPDNGMYRAKNEIKAWKGLTKTSAAAQPPQRAPGQAPAPVSQAAPARQQAPAETRVAPPWAAR